jgi:hypothetical protein
MSIDAKRLASRAALLLACGLLAFATGALVVHAATTAQTTKKKKQTGTAPAFMIRAEVMGKLAPGRAVPVKIALANNRLKPIWIRRLSIRLAIDPAHVRAGCTATRDYHVVQLPKRVFPFKLATFHRATKKHKARLRWRTLRARRTLGKPQLMMLNLPGVNQNACKGSTLTLTFATNSTLKKPRHKKAWKAAAER